MSASLISRYMPEWSLRQIDRVAVTASPADAWAAVRSVDFYRIRFVRWLFGMRALPDRLSAAIHGKPFASARSSSMTIDDIAHAGTGFLLLAEEPGTEVVLGAIGKFWQPSIDFAKVTPDGFAAFATPGFGKVAWCIRVDPRVGGGSWIGVDVRVSTTDPESLERFKPYWRLIGPFSHRMRRSLLRSMKRRLGAPSDDSLALTGDALLPDAALQKTHAVTIEAPPHRVWPWLTQIGAGRAGWYSWDRLDNGGVHSAERIVPELQHLAVGDVVPGLPDDPEGEGFAVLELDPGKSLVLGDPALLPGRTRTGGPPWSTTWEFALHPIGETATRLVVRVRARFEPTLRMAVLEPLMLGLHEIMERRQLANLRRRAEAA